jgi:hypothetical protein
VGPVPALRHLAVGQRRARPADADDASEHERVQAEALAGSVIVESRTWTNKDETRTIEIFRAMPIDNVSTGEVKLTVRNNEDLTSEEITMSTTIWKTLTESDPYG